MADTKSDREVADYIVVGGGSAGAAIAGRLAENGRFNVILIEAGTSGRKPFLMVPGAMALVRDWGQYAWLYQTEPDPSRQGRTDVWRRGRSLGGSSSINGVIWARGLPSDFDRWPELGAPGWDWNSVLPHFKTAERALGFSSHQRGRNGPIWIEQFRSPHHLAQDLLKSFDLKGIPTVRDINTATGVAAAITQTNQKRGIRQSTETAYLRQLPRRCKLEVRTQTVAQRILFDGHIATGVEIRRKDGTVAVIESSREIIVCAGAIESPALLLRSGIGPADDLAALGIPLIRHAPEVGGNLQDHPDLYVEYAVSPRTYSDAAKWHRMVGIGLDFLLRRRGAATSPGTHLFAYGNVDLSQSVPKLLIFAAPFGSINETAFGRNQPVFSLTPSICQPYSRGHVRLRDAALTSQPVIQPNLLGDSRDLELIVDAIGYMDQLVAQDPFAQHVLHRLTPDPRFNASDREALREFARSAVTTCHHSCGTCRMGNDERAVVDPKLRVRGVERLRVADASVFPEITSGNLNAPVIMVGERAASFILSGN